MSTSHLFYPRPSYSVFCIQLPEVTKKTRALVARNILRSLYPGRIDECKIKLVRNGGDNNWIAFLYPRHDGRELLCVSTLFIRCIVKERDCVVHFVASDYIETVSIKDGRMRSSSVTALSEVECIPIVHGIKNIIYAQRSITRPRDVDTEWIVVEDATRGLFSYQYALNPEKSVFLRTVHALLWIGLAGMLSVLAMSYVSTAHERLERIEDEREYQRIQNQRKADEQRENKRHDELVSRYNEILLSIPYDPYSVLQIVTVAVGKGSTITGLSIHENEFTLNLETENPVQVIEAMEKNPLVYNLHFDESAGSAFSSGTRTVKRKLVITACLYYHKYVDIDGSPFAETNDALEKKIANAGDTLSPENKMRLSDYLWIIQEIARKSGVSVDSIQTSEQNGTLAIRFDMAGKSRTVIEFLRRSCDSLETFKYTSANIRFMPDSGSMELDGIIRTELETGISSDKAKDVAGSSQSVVDVSSVLSSFNTRMQISPDSSSENSSAVRKEAESVPWLVFMGTVAGKDGNCIYVKNLRTNEITRFSESAEGSGGYKTIGSNKFEICLNNTRYLVSRIK